MKYRKRTSSSIHVIASVSAAIFLIILLFSPTAFGQVPQEQPESIPKASPPPEDIIRINHEVLDRILRKYVDKKGLVDYKSLKRDKEDLALLKSYIDDLCEINPDLLGHPTEINTAWLNLHNAIVLWQVLEKYPLTSPLKAPNFFSEQRWKIGSKKYSLLDFEQEIFKKKIRDPRMVMARVLATQGGARLPPFAYSGDKIEEQLDEAAVRFLKEPYNVVWDPKKKRLFVTGYLDWHREELGNIEMLIRSYQKGLPEKISIVYGPFNWTLNDRALE
ncbi:MAG: DUF547 domain-containing protein [Deltaproteobacteria bacterium]|nr:DUF547 domain-containing protein [Deltaproteobacteria bacterium]